MRLGATSRLALSILSLICESETQHIHCFVSVFLDSTALRTEQERPFGGPIRLMPPAGCRGCCGVKKPRLQSQLLTHRRRCFILQLLRESIQAVEDASHAHLVWSCGVRADFEAFLLICLRVNLCWIPCRLNLAVLPRQVLPKVTKNLQKLQTNLAKGAVVAPRTRFDSLQTCSLLQLGHVQQNHQTLAFLMRAQSATHDACSSHQTHPTIPTTER